MPRRLEPSVRTVLLAACGLWIATAARADDTPVLPPAWTSPAVAPTFGEPVAPFVLDRDSPAGRTATECLTEAVYYEAATEVRGGQEAVAQVVLNRVRHPNYPKSVCGVVYQGVGTGGACQFSFACDGSMNRPRAPRLWRSAEEVAAAALDGHVAATAGASTHYHAGWANPYWRTSLVETGRIGTQIFYHLPGRLGSSRALSAPYSGVENLPPLRPAGQAARSAVTRGPSLPRDSAVTFSPWGLTIATVSSDHGAVRVRSTS